MGSAEEKRGELYGPIADMVAEHGIRDVLFMLGVVVADDGDETVGEALMKVGAEVENGRE